VPLPPGGCPVCGSRMALAGDAEVRRLDGGRVRCVVLTCLGKDCSLATVHPLGRSLRALFHDDVLPALDPVAELAREGRLRLPARAPASRRR